MLRRHRLARKLPPGALSGHIEKMPYANRVMAMPGQMRGRAAPWLLPPSPRQVRATYSTA
jgi:hypothetical protein